MKYGDVGGRDGFSVVEVIIAMVVLSFGVLAMAAMSSHLLMQIRIADSQTERAAAVQQVVEQLRAMPYETLQTRESGSAGTIGSFDIEWERRTTDANLTRIDVYTTGPGYRSGEGWLLERQDTFLISLARMD